MCLTLDKLVQDWCEESSAQTRTCCSIRAKTGTTRPMSTTLNKKTVFFRRGWCISTMSLQSSYELLVAPKGSLFNCAHLDTPSSEPAPLPTKTWDAIATNLRQRSKVEAVSGIHTSRFACGRASWDFRGISTGKTRSQKAKHLKQARRAKGYRLLPDCQMSLSGFVCFCWRAPIQVFERPRATPRGSNLRKPSHMSCEGIALSQVTVPWTARSRAGGR